MTTRREFLRTTAAAGGILLAGSSPRALLAAAPAPMNILILGGTGYIGPHLVRHAVNRGHKVTIFTRGRRAADIPDSVVRLVGDRNGQLGALEGKKWVGAIRRCEGTVRAARATGIRQSRHHRSANVHRGSW